jgi:4-hydroxy-3-methylbut-2-enyl diphosphate reductase
VVRAIDSVEQALKRYGAPVYVRHEIVHNRFVVESLKAKGAIFVEELDEIPDTQAPVIFSAHGVPKSIPDEAKRRNFFALDATCPLVTKVHREAEIHFKRGREIILIGHAGHPEVEGTMGQAAGRMYLVESVEDVAKLEVEDSGNLGFVTQTTLSMDDARSITDALKRRFPGILGPKKDDICYATQNRQDAVKALAQRSDVVLVVGSPNSSNSNRLREVAQNVGVSAYMVDKASDLDPQWLEGKQRVGVTAGASAPEVLVRELVERLRALGATEVLEMDGIHEAVVFPLPKALSI